MSKLAGFLLCALLVAFPASSFAAACPAPQVSSGWSQSYPSSKILQSFVYDLDNSLLYTIFYSNQYNTFLQVPISTAQALVYTKTPDTYYTQNIQPVYHQALETEKCQALLAENGTYIVVH